MRRIVTVLMGMVLAVPAFAAQVDCEPARCAVKAAIDAECDCSTATNHGQHVRCVAHVVKRLVDEGTVPTNCKGKIVRCSSRSTCGKLGFVTCNIPVAGTCDLSTGTCARTGTACLTDAECTTIKCKTKSSADRCTLAGGTVGTSSTCCANCGG